MKLRPPLLDVVPVVTIHVVDRPLFWAPGLPALIVKSMAFAVRRAVVVQVAGTQHL